MEKTKKVFRKAPYSEFEEAMRVTKMAEGALAECMGYSSTAVSKWKVDGEIPYVASIALQAVISNNLKSAIIFAPESDMETIRKVVIATGGQFRSLRI